MPYSLEDTLKIVVTTRALFQLEEENNIFETKGTEYYERYQIEHENELLKPGAAFSVIRALLEINKISHIRHKVEVIIMSRNSYNTSLRVFNSLKHYGMDITRGVFSSGAEITPYLLALNADLFLTANEKDSQSAIDAKIPSATLWTGNIPKYDKNEQIKTIKFAFDGDAVLFSEESEKIYKREGLQSFAQYESDNAKIPMEKGPFAKFLAYLSEIQNELKDKEINIRTALITARNAPAHERVVRTFREWNIQVDEVFFLGGIPKRAFLEAFGAHIFFDDQRVHIEDAAPVVPSGRVPYASDSELNGDYAHDGK